MSQHDALVLGAAFVAAFFTGGGLAAWAFAAMSRRADRRAEMQCKFDPMATRGIERGDGLYRATKETRRRTYK